MRSSASFVVASCALFGVASIAAPARGEPAAIYASAGPTAGLSDAATSALARAEARVHASFAAAGVIYPPVAVAFVALKHEARLEAWADDGRGWTFVRSYLVRPASGRLGPKLKEGDHQVPEGVYRITALNPASSYYLSLRLDYPNAYDRVRALSDRRSSLGGNIAIHGGRASDGCLSVGDGAVEELYAMVSRVGPQHASVIVSPMDLRRISVAEVVARVGVRPHWLPDLYGTIATTLGRFPVATGDGGASTPTASVFAAASAPDGSSATAGTTLSSGRARCRAYDAADCERRCTRGELASCARAGLMYRDGRGVARNADKAWAFLLEACMGGDSFGCAELSLLHLEDTGLRRDAAAAARLARAACDSGEGHGCATLANLCIDGVLYPEASQACGPDDVRRLRDRAVAGLGGNCRGWGAYDCDALAKIYSSGDRATALRFAAGSCDGGDPGGCYALAKLSDDGSGATGAHDLYRRACDEGFSTACEHSGAVAPVAPVADEATSTRPEAHAAANTAGRPWRRTFNR